MFSDEESEIREKIGGEGEMGSENHTAEDEREIWELKRRAADSVKAGDLGIRQHFLRANIVFIADQA